MSNFKTKTVIMLLTFLVCFFAPQPLFLRTAFACTYSVTNTGQMAPGSCVAIHGVDPWYSNCTISPGGATLVHCASDIEYLETWLGAGCTCSGGGSSCFLPGTKIKMEDGEKNIEEVKQGDKVVSVDPKSGVLSDNTVNSLHITSQDHYYIIKTASGKVIRVTDEHPFYTGDKSTVQKSLIQKVQATVSILYIYLQDGWQVTKQEMGIKL